MLLIPGVCGLLGGLFTVQQYLLRGEDQWLGPITWRQAMLDQFLYWVVWAVLCVPILWLAATFRTDNGWSFRGISAHLGFSILVALTHLLLYLTVAFWLPERRSEFSSLLSSGRAQLSLLVTVLTGMIIYGAILILTLTVDYYKQYQATEINALELKSQLTEAQLQSLKMQLHPHFLFNTLHSISALIVKNENRRAVSMISLLGDLLRVALENEHAQLVPLKNELDFLGRYLEIEQTRFRERLQVEMNIEPETLDAMVPNLILQPLVENSIKHGISRYSRAGRIKIHSTLEDDVLRLEVTDDGPGMILTNPELSYEGIGLKNTQSRLAQLYGSEHSFDLQNGPDGGLSVVLKLPFCIHGGEIADSAEIG